ncbi:MAG: TonB-dependent receptor [Candidatus Pseudobacter hemicellulosilyticus]|uniref:TonB-dependent receptor n=1 Tax=Candidatus Pseudobacter hemicellulosilyticus TaxID=3121375 RepID=A0AAJ5WP18_9BACT|nr:MAG: TonB-dependent receptor [Pseudobacter sp.]
MKDSPDSCQNGSGSLLPSQHPFRIFFLLSVFLALLLPALSFGQNQPVTLQAKSDSLELILKKLEKQTGFSFIYENDLLDKAAPVTFNAVNMALKEVLELCFRDQPLAYTIRGNSVILRKKESPPQRSIVVIGSITDPKGQALQGVNVQSKRHTVNVTSMQDGSYSITLPGAEDVLVFTYVGFMPQEIPVSKAGRLDVSMQEKPSQLADVVVVAYGQQKKITTIGAQSTVKVDDLKLPSANLTNSIAGRIAGVIGVQRSGEPGYDNAEIYIRGISTFTSSSPLVLVDGVERGFANVDPEDISSFSILKDASATAVYGVRGANGVILIQTKSGKVGKPMINLQYDQGLTQFTRIPKFADGVTYLNMANEAYKNSNPNDLVPKYSQERIDKTASGEDPDLAPNVNWFDVLFKKYGQNRRARVNASGGSQNAQYYLSLGYYDETGMFDTDPLANYNSQLRFTRYNFTSNLNLRLTKTTKLDFGASGWLSNGNFPGANTPDIWSAAYLLPPVVIPDKYSNGLFSRMATGTLNNPYTMLTQSGYVTEFRSQLWSNIRVTQELDALLKGLSATVMYSFDNYNTHTIRRTKSVDGYIARSRDNNGNLVMEQTSIGSNYLGYERQNGGSRQYYTEAAVNYRTAIGKNDLTGMVLFNASDKQDAFAGDYVNSVPYRYVGLAGRFTYAYNNRYLAEANFGYNGSETFEPNKRFGFFPSFGAGWVASEEKFFEPLTDAVQFLKFRFSYGEVGNSNIGGRRFGYVSTVGGGNGGYSFGRDVNRTIGGLDIDEYAVSVSWEKAQKTNLGVEIKTWNNRLSLTVDLFNENRTGIFRKRGDVPVYSGIRNLPWANLGEIQNKGIDATLELNGKWGDVNLDFRGNFTWNRAMVVNDANAPFPYPWQQRIGRKYGQRFGYTALGLFTSEKDVLSSPYQTGTNKEGDIKYKDMNADGKIDSYDAGPIGYGSMPEIVYGFGPTISWKGWSLAGWFKGVSKVDIDLNGDGLQPFSQGGEYGNLLAQITDRWYPGSTNPHPFYPRLTYGNDNMNYATSTWWVKNGAFLRLQTLQLGYTFSNKPWLKQMGMSNINLYFLGNNLATFSEFKLWDVELGSGRGAQYPLVKTFNAGVKFTFR